MVALVEAASSACVIYDDHNGTLVNLLDITDKSLDLDTKYFTVTVNILTPNFPNPPPSSSSSNNTQQINAVLVKGEFEQLETIVAMDFFTSTDIRLFMPGTTPTPAQLQFCFEHEVAYLNLDEEPEGVLIALQNSATWSGLVMKSSSTPAPTPSSSSSAATTATSPQPTLDHLVDQGQLLDELDALDGLDDDFASLLSLVSRTRGAGATMSDEQRRANAERVALALESMLGGGSSDEE